MKNYKRNHEKERTLISLPKKAFLEIIKTKKQLLIFEMIPDRSVICSERIQNIIDRLLGDLKSGTGS